MINLVSMFKKALTPNMASFHAYFPEVAAKETRTAIIRSHQSLPPGDYIFQELYCTRRGCDCRNVILSVSDDTGRTLATLNHALDPDGFKDIGEPRTFLDGLNIQTEHATALLELFENSVLDSAYAERLERHYRMIKEKVQGGPFPTRRATATTSDPKVSLAKMEQWPQSWKMVPADVAIGKALVEVLKPFLRWLCDQNISHNTLRRHVDNLWLLGGEIIRKMNQDAALRKLPAEAAILECVDEEGGPLAFSEAEAGQRDLDATCRKLHRFLRARMPASRPTAT